jgi:hypothetical protein
LPNLTGPALTTGAAERLALKTPAYFTDENGVGTSN